MSTNLLSHLIDEIIALLKPLATAVDDPWVLDSLLRILDANDPRLTSGLVDGLHTLGKGIAELKTLQTSSGASLQSISIALNALRDLTAAARALGHTNESLYPALGADLVNIMVLTRLRLASPFAYQLAAMIGIAEYKILPAIRIANEVVRYPQPVERLVFDRIGTLFTNPLALIREQLPSPPLATIASTEQTADIIINRIGGVLNALGIPWMYGYPPGDEKFLAESAEQAAHTLVIYLPSEIVGVDVQAGICINLSSAETDDLGVVLTPFGGLTLQGTLGQWIIKTGLTTDVQALAFGGGQGVKVLASASTTNVHAIVSATLPPAESGMSAAVLGSSDGTRLELGAPNLSVILDTTQTGFNTELSVDTGKSALVIAPGDGDGFLRSILPTKGLKANFDLGLSWSKKRGLTFRGAGSLDATLPVGLSIGSALTVPTIHLSLQAKDTSLTAEISASIGLAIGPVQALVDRVGIRSVVTFPESGGNLGVADLDFHFKPPSGAGLVIDASVVVGGGYLHFDPQKEEYSGIIDLQIADKIAVKGIGLLTTRLPGDAKGYSLVIIIFAEDFTPIQLGLGFTLIGIGGLLAINRTFDETALRAGLKNHALDSILFPKDPVRNATQLLSNLNKVFPAKKGNHLFGPMAQIAWGTPPLITADLALVLEFGERLRLLILAQVVAVLPTRENELVRLQMDAVGVIDFDQGTAELDATLYDSRLLKKFVLTGDMALRMQWEGAKNFALAVGGLHPAFNPPANFPKLERVAINLASGDNPRIRCEAYFALTANTVQFGARAELYAEAHNFSIHGEIGYDVLIQLDPFHFVADFHAQLQLKHGSSNLFKVKVEGELSGPRPLHLKAKATFEIMWWDVSIRVNKTLVEGDLPPLPKPINVLPLLKEALNNSSNWTARLPDGQRPMVTLRTRANVAGEVCIHPLGILTVKQGVVPLNMDISRFGPAAPAGARRFTIKNVRLGNLSSAKLGDSEILRPEKDFFAPAQFFEMSDDQKLSRPSFEALPAGVSFGLEEFTFTETKDDWLEVEAIKFETIIVDNTQPAPTPRDSNNRYTLSAILLASQSRFGAAGVSDLRRTGKAKYSTAKDKYRAVNKGWIIVTAADLSAQPMPGIEAGKPASYSEAVQALNQLKQENPAIAAGFKILRPSDVQAID